MRPASLLAALGLALGVALLVGEQARAQDPPKVTLTVRGVAGPVIKSRPRRFVAVNVVLENASAVDQDGLLRVYRVEGPNQPAAQQQLFYERRVALPRGARRVETVYYYVQEEEPNRQLCVAYAPDEGTAPDPSYPDLQVIDNRMMALAISSHETDEATRVLRAALVPGPREPWRCDVLRAEPTALPDHIVGYDAFDAVLVTDLDAADLPPDRAKVLVDWVGAGGELLVAFSGRGVQLPDALRPLLPIARPGGPPRTIELPLRGLRALGRGGDWTSLVEGKVLADDIRVGAGAELLATEGPQPLVVRGRWGAGWVTYCAFPLDASQLRRWPGLPSLGGALLLPPREPLGDKRQAAPAPPSEELLWNLSEAIESLEPPSALSVAPLLMLYVALVSPMTYVLLSRRGKLGLAQPVAAGVVVAFGALFYGLGRASKGSEDLVTQVAIVDLPTGGAEAASIAARVDVMTGYYSTRQGLASAQGPRGAQVGAIAEQITSREGRVIEGGDATRLEDVTVATWSLRRFRSTRAAKLGYVEVKLDLTQQTVSGTITNVTEHPLETPLLLLPNGLLELGGTIDAKQTLRIPGYGLQRYDDLEGSQAVDKLPWIQAFLKDAPPSGYAPLYGQGLSVGSMAGDPYDGSNARRILGILRQRLERVPGSSDRVPALLVARMTSDPGGVVVEGTDTPALSRSLVVVETQVTLPSGPFLLRGLPARVMGWSQGESDWVPVGGSTGAPGMIGGSPLAEAVVEFAWTVPVTEKTRVTDLRVRWRTNPDTAIAPKLTTLELYSYRLRAWVEGMADVATAPRDPDGVKGWAPDPDSQDPRVRELRAEDFVDPASGAVHVRIRNQGTDLGIVKLVLDVAGTRE
jgi:hypothetical protein